MTADRTRQHTDGQPSLGSDRTDVERPGPAEDPVTLAARLGAPARWLVVVDFDGTLSPIVDRPDVATAATGAVEALGALARLTTIAIVSGRPILELRERLESLPLWYVGGHGAELHSPDGSDERLLDPEVVRDHLDAVEEDVRQLVDEEPGWLVERKEASLAVHHRLATHESVTALLPRVEARFAHDADTDPGFTTLTGKAVLELRPRTIHKGAALADIAGRTPGLLPLAIGDDVTDEDTFREAVARGGTAIVVGDDDRSSLAQYRLADPDAVVRLLVELGRTED